MQQYFAINKNLELLDSDYHHIKNVMKMKPGNIIKVVFDNTLYDCRLTKVAKKSEFEVINEVIMEEKGKQITVAFSLIKEQKLNYLLQKSTEAGVAGFIVLSTDRSVVKIENKKEDAKLKRWHMICKEASEQSFRSNIPSIDGIYNLKKLEAEKFDLKLLCSLNEKTENIKKVLQKNTNCDRILLVIGPEGGFSSKEEKFLLENGFISISLGENVYRAETAAVVALSMINYEFMR